MRTKIIALLLASAGARRHRRLPAEARDDDRGEPSRAASSGIDLAAMDKSVKPGDDFFVFANGSWVKNTPKSRRTASNIGGFYIADQKREKQTRRAARRHRSSPNAAAGSERGARSPIIYNAF